MRKIILASSSPRRADLLRQIGLPFDICVRPVDESCPPGLPPHVLVEVLAARKAAAVAETAGEGLIIGADTVVVRRKQVLGKPDDENEAVRMLQNLSGGAHAVFTGLALLDAASGRSLVRHEKTRVHFKRLAEDEIRRYVATGEPLDKAGSYGAQGRGAVFVRGIEGCYSNVVGLPLSLLAEMLKEFGRPVI